MFARSFVRQVLAAFVMATFMIAAGGLSGCGSDSGAEPAGNGQTRQVLAEDAKEKTRAAGKYAKAKSIKDRTVAGEGPGGR